MLTPAGRRGAREGRRRCLRFAFTTRWRPDGMHNHVQLRRRLGCRSCRGPFLGGIWDLVHARLFSAEDR